MSRIAGLAVLAVLMALVAAFPAGTQAQESRYGATLQGTYGHTLTQATPNPPGELGAVAAVRFLPGGLQQAVAEPTRRGGGSAMVVHPD